MLIVGAKGFAKELIDAVSEKDLENLVFFDDVNPDVARELFGKFKILKSVAEAKQHFGQDNRFALGVGNPKIRKMIAQKFTDLGGNLVSVISDHASIGKFEVEIGEGATILAGATISNSAKLGKACLVYYGSKITHDCVVGDFCEISPGAAILGRCTIGAETQIGSNATILPDISIGRNVVVGAGAVVTKDIPDNSIAVGVPARIVAHQND